MTTRYERMKMQRRMQRRIRLVVEERRMSLARPDQHAEPAVEERRMSVARPDHHAEPGEVTVEIPAGAPRPMPPAARAVGRVTVRSA